MATRDAQTTLSSLYQFRVQLVRADRILQCFYGNQIGSYTHWEMFKVLFPATFTAVIDPFNCSCLCLHGTRCVHLAARHQDRVLFTVQSPTEFHLHGLRE
ncbi:unnamed protein product [Colias eurytheme]|nr:unnamed protein product [Colias eurytheme]